MSIMFTTGQTINSNQNQSTSKSMPIQPGVTFTEKNAALFELKEPKLNDSVKEELTKEEEEKFYKKVFKTSLI